MLYLLQHGIDRVNIKIEITILLSISKPTLSFLYKYWNIISKSMFSLVSAVEVGRYWQAKTGSTFIDRFNLSTSFSLLDV